MVHDLKIAPVFFLAIESGRKTFEIRKDDRGFQNGDTIKLQEYDPVTESYTGREMVAEITYVSTFLQKPDIVVFSISLMGGSYTVEG